VLIGQRKALAIAVKGDRKRRRWSKLRERNEDLLASCADYLGCSGIESAAADETADKTAQL
jgi:hypothetical protein